MHEVPPGTIEPVVYHARAPVVYPTRPRAGVRWIIGFDTSPGV
jgi:hypothetical protein